MSLLKAARIGAAAALVALAAPARAHDETVSASEVEIGPQAVTFRVDVGLVGLGKALGWAAPPDEAGVRARGAEIARVLAEGLEVVVGGRALVARAGALSLRHEPAPGSGRSELARVVQELVFSSPAPIERVTLRVRFFAALTSQHRALIDVRWGEEQRRFSRLGPTELELARGQLRPSAWRTLGEFLVWGAEHIVYGLDHLAFLLALLLAVTRFVELVKVVTAFTVAHSVTLVLAARGWLVIPTRLTEVLIAASIVYLAIENLVFAEKTARHRWRLGFAFGLVHGLGFAVELRERLQELGTGVVLPLFAFNLGVELAQVAFVALVFPLLRLLRNGPVPEARLLRVGSLPILALGLYWLLQRLGG